MGSLFRINVCLNQELPDTSQFSEIYAHVTAYGNGWRMDIEKQVPRTLYPRLGPVGVSVALTVRIKTKIECLEFGARPHKHQKS